jgi:hypothetical protein
MENCAAGTEKLNKNNERGHNEEISIDNGGESAVRGNNGISEWPLWAG